MPLRNVRHVMKFFILISFLILNFFSILFAEQGFEDAFSLNKVLESARKNNPEILAAKKRRDVFLAKIKSESALEKPRVGYEQMYSGDEKNLTVSQEFPFFGKLRIRKQAASKEALMAEQSLIAKEKEILAKTKTAYAMLFLADRSIDLYQENVELMKHFSKVSESKYAVGKVSQSDVLRAQVELSKMLNMLITLNQEKETAHAMLNSLFKQTPDERIAIPQEPKTKKIEFNLQTLQETALGNRPELREAYHHVHHSNTMLTAARFEYLPDIMAQYRYRTALNSAMDKSQDIMVGMTVPLWFWKQKAMVQTARLEKEMAEAEYQAMKNRTLFEIKDLFVKVQTAERMVELYQTSVIPQAESALKITESAYQSDRVSFLELIDAQKNLLQFRLDYCQYLTEHEKQIAELERAVGKEL